MLEEKDGKERIDVGDCTLTIDQRNALIQQLAYKDMRPFLDKFIKDIEDFVSTTEKKYCANSA